MVDHCPLETNKDIYATLCENKNNYSTFANFIPVVALGIPFFNIYCAACHGMLRKDIEILTKNLEVQCLTHKSSNSKALPPSPWNHFYPQYKCHAVKIEYSQQYEPLGKRILENCGCFESIDDCDGGQYEEECFAYAAPEIYGKHIIVKNEACLACVKIGNDTITAELPRRCKKTQNNKFDIVTSLFKFVGSSPVSKTCQRLFPVGQPGNRCLIQRCQPGFRLHDGHCITINDSISCLNPRQNFYENEYNVADLYRPALLAFIQHDRKEKKYEKLIDEFMERFFNLAKPCPRLQETVYRDLFEEDDLINTCFLVSFPPYSYTNIVQMMTSGQLERTLFPGNQVVKIAAINHDPNIGMNCSRKSSSYRLTNNVRSTIHKMEFLSRKGGRLVVSNRDPMVAIKEVKNKRITYHALYCKLNLDRQGCGIKRNMSHLLYENCPKYELKQLPLNWKESMTLSNGVVLMASDYIYSKHGNVFVCADIYDQRYKGEKSGKMVIVVTACYSVSLVSLLLTFLIHVRYSPLRTLPGLMLMNLIAALFTAQLLYLMNIYGIFASNRILCQTQASIQHYLWLTSFAWMASLSLDVFKCLLPSCITVNTDGGANYKKYMVLAWLFPLPIPVLANILGNINPEFLGYDATLCWLSGSQSVLYLFALPVLIMLTFNIILFVGSVYRLGTHMKNAIYVGRKVENKQRLAQCIKLSSWMGITWLFGIIPNFVDIEALWYAFTVANSFQGVHIFLAFGATGRARMLMKKYHQDKQTETVSVSTPIPTVSAKTDIE